MRPDQVSLLKTMFNKMDSDQNGTLSEMEVKKGLYEIENGEALFDCLRNADIDGDNKIDFDEFLACAIDVNVFVSDNYLKMAFNHFDKDRSGYLDRD